MGTGIESVNTLRGEYPDFKSYKSVDTMACTDSLKVTFKWFIKMSTFQLKKYIFSKYVEVIFLHFCVSTVFIDNNGCFVAVINLQLEQKMTKHTYLGGSSIQH